MSQLIKILRLEAPSWIPLRYRDKDGFFSFDLTKEASLVISKDYESDKLGSDVVRNYTLPNTPKNRALIGPYGSPLAQMNHYTPIPIKIVSGGLELPQEVLYIRSWGDSKEIEVEIIGVEDQWLKALENIPINCLEWPNVEFLDWDWVKDKHEFHNVWEDGEEPYFPPFVNYGAWKNVDCVSLEDIRLWVSPLWILKEGFCKAGYVFNCPMLETELGRRLWCYLLKENYQEISTGEEEGFWATVNGPIPFPVVNIGDPPQILVFDNDTTSPGFDNSGFYDNVSGEYGPRNIVADYTANISIDIDIVNPAFGVGIVSLELYKEDTFGNVTFLNGTSLEITQPNTSIQEVKALAVETNNTEKIFVILFGFNVVGTLDGGNFFNNPISIPVGLGSTIKGKEIIDPSLTIRGLLEGMSHLFKWEWETVQNVVSFFPTEKLDWYGEEGLEGFFRENSQAKDLSGKIKCNSLDVSLNRSRKKRFFQAEFKKDSKDNWANSAPFELPLHSSLKDYGEEYPPGKEKSPNPFFAATRMKYQEKILIEWGGIFPNTRPYFPTIWGGDKNEEGELPPQIKKICPRIILSHPYGQAQAPRVNATSGITGAGFNLCNYNNVARSPFQSFSLAGSIFPTGFLSDFGLPVDEAIVYGASQIRNDIEGNFSLFWEAGIDQLYKGFQMEFLVLFSFLDMAQHSPRDIFLIRYLSETLGYIEFYSRISQISEYRANINEYTPITFRPELIGEKVCECGICFVEIVKSGEDGSPQSFTMFPRGECGEVISYSWEVTIIDANIDTIEGEEEAILTITGTTPIEWEFSLIATLETTCGIFAANYIQ